MQQPPNLYPHYPQRQWQQPPMPPTKKKSLKGVFIVLSLILAVTLVGCGGSGTGNSPTTQTTQQPTTAPTPKPTIQPTVAPTQAATAPIPSASELSQLFSAKDGSVTNVNINKIANGSTGVALDVQVNNPTQTSVKHINYILMQFFFGSRTDVGLVNIAFHADGYTGADDPIAQCGGVSS